MIRFWILTTVLVYVLLGCSQKGKYEFIVTDYGAKGDSSTLNTRAIQEAIDDCALSGGGTVIFPPGKYITGTISLKSNIELHFMPGSFLIGSSQISDYISPQGQSNILLIRQSDSIQDQILRVLIDATAVENVSITGQGTIEGNGKAFWDDNFNAKERPLPWISFRNAKNIIIRDITLQNSPSHVLRFKDCRHIYISGIKIFNHPQSPNTDGIDLVDVQNAVISDCMIYTGDDAICLKTDAGGLVENITVTNCIIESDDAALKFGTGSAGVTRNCTFSNITINRSRYGVSLFMLEGGVFENCSFNNLAIRKGSRHKYEYPLFIDIDRKRPDDKLGLIRNIGFQNLSITTGGKILITGNPQSMIENLTINNCLLSIEEETDFSDASKPRGNKNFPKLEGSIDRARVDAHFTMGYIRGLNLSDIQIKAVSSKRRAIDLVGVEALKITGNNGWELKNF